MKTFYHQTISIITIALFLTIVSIILFFSPEKKKEFFPQKNENVEELTDAIEKIIREINECNLSYQFETIYNLIEIFGKRYPDMKIIKEALLNKTNKKLSTLQPQ